MAGLARMLLERAAAALYDDAGDPGREHEERRTASTNARIEARRRERERAINDAFDGMYDELDTEGGEH